MDLSKFIDNNKDEIIKETQNLIKIKSVEGEPNGDYPFGKDVYDALVHTLNLCEKMGFKTKNIDNQIGYAEIGSGDELISILVHLDVVPAGDLETWNYDPFKGEIEGDKLYGRGSIDNKGPAIASIYAVKAIMESDIELNKRIRIIFGTNEETGSKSIDHYKEVGEEIPDVAFTPDADFPVIHGEMGILIFDIIENFEENLDDGGIEVLEIKGGNAVNMVPDKAYAKLVENKPFKHILEAFNKEHDAKLSYEDKMDYVLVTAEGKSAHGSEPYKGINAISYLMKFLSLIDLQIGDISNFIRFYAHHIDLDFNGEKIGCDFKDDISGELILNIGKIKINKDLGKIGVNIRYPINFSDEDVFTALEKNIGNSPYNLKDNIKIEKDLHLEPLFVPKDSKLVKSLMKVYKKHTDDDTEPQVIGGGTYARSMDNAVAFGTLFPNREGVEHQANEYIYIEDLMKATKIYADALVELLK